MNRLKRFLGSFVFLLFLSVSVIGNAFALQPKIITMDSNDITTEIISEAEHSERIIVDNDSPLVFEKSDLLFDDFEKTTDKDISTKYVGYVFAGPNQIHAYPLVCNLNTGDLFYYNTIGDSVYFSMLSQYSNIKFTKSEAMNLYNRALGVAYTNEPQYSYGIVGWYIISEIDLMADRPKYVEYRIAEPNFGVGSDYEKWNVPYEKVRITLQGACAFPDDYSETQYFHIGGVEGSYYYTADNGKVLSVPFGAGISVNVKN